MNTSHSNCTHEATKAGRLACRKARALRVAAIAELETYFTANGDRDWLMRGARRFASYEGSDTFDAADALLSHFEPSGDKETDDRRIRNGYLITSSPHRIRSIILRAFS